MSEHNSYCTIIVFNFKYHMVSNAVVNQRPRGTGHDINRAYLFNESKTRHRRGSWADYPVSMGVSHTGQFARHGWICKTVHTGSAVH